MENQVVDAVTLGQSVMAHDMSMWGLFMQAGIVVKTVMIGLMLASVWVWAIVIEKLIRLRKLRAQANTFEEAFWSGGSLEDLYDRIADQPRDPMSAIFVSAMREWRRSNARGVKGETMRARLQQRLERSMEITLGREMDRVERYMTFLASVGSTAPFVGLFGTVWGIMVSF
ncbi:MotA/TolQ/ExbB proton channel family protein, partial [Thalassospira sp.]